MSTAPAPSTLARRQRVAELHAAGRTHLQIADELRVVTDTVTKDLRVVAPPCPLPAFDPDRARVYVSECRRISGTVAAKRAGLTPAEVRGWMSVGKRWRLPPFAGFADAVLAGRAERRKAFAERAERNRLLLPAAVAELRAVLRDRLVKHFEQPAVRTRVQRALDLPRGDFWSVVATVEAHLFDPDDGHPGLVPDAGFERCAPDWLRALARRLAEAPVTLTAATP